MSLDRSALELIQETILTAENKADSRSEFAISTISKNMQIVSLEKYQEFRNRFRAEFETETLADYIAYVKENSGSHSYINAGVMRAVTVFDIGDEDEAGHCEHKAKLAMVKTPEYSAVLGVNGERISQRVLAEFIEDWMPNISVVDADGEDMENKVAINAIRRITIENLSSAAAPRQATISLSVLSFSRSQIQNPGLSSQSEG